MTYILEWSGANETSLLVDDRVRLNPDLCKCPGKKDHCHCNKVFLQQAGRDHVHAKETNGEVTAVNLASAGRYQNNKDLDKLKGVKLVTLEFASPAGESSCKHLAGKDRVS